MTITGTLSLLFESFFDIRNFFVIFVTFCSKVSWCFPVSLLAITWVYVHCLLVFVDGYWHIVVADGAISRQDCQPIISAASKEQVGSVFQLNSEAAQISDHGRYTMIVPRLVWAYGPASLHTSSPPQGR